MKIKYHFEIKYFPNPKVNEFMRRADLFKEGEGAFLTEKFAVTYKTGTVVDEKLIKQTEKEIKKAFESVGCEVFSVKHI